MSIIFTSLFSNQYAYIRLHEKKKKHPFTIQAYGNAALTETIEDAKKQVFEISIQNNLLFNVSNIKPKSALLNNPTEIKISILTYLNKKDLHTCMLVCKEIHIISKPLLLEMAKDTIQYDFSDLENQLDKRLKDIELPMENTFPMTSFKKKFHLYVEPIKVSIHQISSFKLHCFKLLITSSLDESRDIKCLLRKVNKLLQACYSYTNCIRLNSQPKKLNICRRIYKLIFKKQ